METKHTPGPWKFEDGEILSDEVLICELFNDKDFAKNPHRSDYQRLPNNSTGESEANAKLIAAAPEMLQALNELLDEVAKQCSIGSDPKLRALMDKWQAGTQAIKKATE